MPEPETYHNENHYESKSSIPVVATSDTAKYEEESKSPEKTAGHEAVSDGRENSKDEGGSYVGTGDSFPGGDSFLGEFPGEHGDFPTLNTPAPMKDISRCLTSSCGNGSVTIRVVKILGSWLFHFGWYLAPRWSLA